MPQHTEAELRKRQREEVARLNANATRKSAFDVADEQAAAQRSRDDNTVNNSATRARGTAPVVSIGGQPTDDVVTSAQTGKPAPRPKRKKK